MPSQSRSQPAGSHRTRVGSGMLFRCSEVARTGTVLSQKIVGVDELAQAQRQASTADTAAQPVPKVLQPDDPGRPATTREPKTQGREGDPHRGGSGTAAHAPHSTDPRPEPAHRGRHRTRRRRADGGSGGRRTAEGATRNPGRVSTGRRAGGLERGPGKRNAAGELAPNSSRHFGDALAAPSAVGPGVIQQGLYDRSRTDALVQRPAELQASR